MTEPFGLTRRTLLRTAVAFTAPVALAWAVGQKSLINLDSAGAQPLRLTPACADSDDPTPSQTEGPYFTRDSPQTASLIQPGATGTRLGVSGFVLTSDCQPVGGALLDFWQADERGQYDNVGYRYRGHQFTDAEGRFYVETVLPGLYPGRTRHIHVKVQAPGGRILTTQLYFPDEPGNARDGIYRPELEMSVRDDEAGGKLARFDFVVSTV